MKDFSNTIYVVIIALLTILVMFIDKSKTDNVFLVYIIGISVGFITGVFTYSDK